ncbi:hypothetical protein OROGR_001303 [Orobanche gracilis]
MASGSPAMNKIERAHQMYRDGKYAEALDYYSDALSMAKTPPQKIALHSNRAACYLKLHDFNKAAEECTSVLELDYKHTGALMLRAQTLVTLKQYHSALFDVNRLIELNPSSELYRNLLARLKTQVYAVDIAFSKFSSYTPSIPLENGTLIKRKSLAPIPEDEAECEEEDEEEEEQEEKKADKGQLTRENNTAAANSKTSDFENVNLTAEVSLRLSENQTQRPSDQQSSGWQTIPKPKGHSHLDYSRWDRVEDDSSEEESEDDEDDDCQPQYRFRVKTVDVKAVK